MDSVTEYDPNDKKNYTRPTTTGGQVSSDLAAAAAATTAGKGLAAAARPSSRKPMPKQSDFPGDMNGFSEAVRKWRTEADADPENQAQKKALRSMSPGG